MSLSDRYDYLKAAKASIYNNAREGGGGSWGRFEDQRGTWKGKGTCRDKGTVASARGRAGAEGTVPMGGAASTPTLQHRPATAQILLLELPNCPCPGPGCPQPQRPGERHCRQCTDSGACSGCCAIHRDTFN